MYHQLGTCGKKEIYKDHAVAQDHSGNIQGGQIWERNGCARVVGWGQQGLNNHRRVRDVSNLVSKGASERRKGGRWTWSTVRGIKRKGADECVGGGEHDGKENKIDPVTKGCMKYRQDGLYEQRRPVAKKERENSLWTMAEMRGNVKAFRWVLATVQPEEVTIHTRLWKMKNGQKISCRNTGGGWRKTENLGRSYYKNAVRG